MAVADDSVWQTLGIDPTDDAGVIRRAYAQRLRAVHPEDDPEGFGTLRLAYEQAVVMARTRHLRSLEEEFVPGSTEALLERPTSDAPTVAEGPRVRPPYPESLTIDQMLDEMAVDEQREPELERLRLALVQELRHDGNARLKTAALERIFRSEAMKSSRLYAETEAWLATLILRGASPETEPLLDPTMAFFSWDDAPSDYRSRYGERARSRRDAVNLRNRFSNPAHRLHKAYLAIHRPLLDSYRFQYGVTFGLRPRVAELLRSVEGDREFERLLDPEAVAWWRKQLAGVGCGPARFWGMVILPPAVAKLATFSAGPDSRETIFFVGWLVVLCGYLVVMLLFLAFAAWSRKSSAASTEWIRDLGEAAP